jgi:hypothetical protein
MSDTLDLTGDIAAAVNGAALRGATLALAYVRENGSPSVSFRGSTQVHGPGELALWARKRDSGLATAIANEPRVSLVYYGPGGPGPMYLAIEGRARVAPEFNEQVWTAMIDGERQQDPERQGVAVVIEVDSVAGAGPDGYFQQTRS